MVLEINPREFDQQVWQYESNRTEEEYNKWLQEDILEQLDILLNNATKVEDAISSTGNHYYDSFVIGDLANMLRNVKIKVKK